MNRFLTLLITLCLLLPSVGHAAAPATITGNGILSPNEAPEAANPFEACRSGKYPGIGWNAVTKRFAATCGNHNFGKYQGIDVVYEVDCTALGTPHRSCLRAGERRQIGALYSVGLAPFYTDDGGTVYVPNFPGKDHGIYVDIGCGPGSDGTAVECPQPYDPERIALTDAKNRPVFSKIGYTHRVELIRGGQRRVNIVFEGSPDVKDELSNTPRLIGGWLVNDRGADPANTGVSAAGRSGSNSSYIGDWIFGTGYASFTGTAGPGYCRQEGTASSFKCDLNPSDRGTSDWAANQTASFSPYGVQGHLAASIDLSSAEQISGAFNNAIGYCANNNAEPCNQNSDCASGTCTINVATTSATCQYDRKVRCWSFDENATRASGGCKSADGSVDLGLCQGFVDALQYDMETGVNGTSNKKQYHLMATYGACDLGPEDAASDAACNTGSFVHPVPIRSFDQTLTTRCTGAIAEGCKEINFGTNQHHPTDTGGVYQGAGFEQRHIPTGIGTAAIDAQFVPIELSRFDLGNTGLQNVGLMPSDWYGKTTCLSGNNTSSANDETACDTAAIVGQMPGFNGLVKNMIVFNASGINKTDIDGDLGALYPTYDGGKVLLGRRNGMADPHAGWTYKNLQWLYNYSTATMINFFGPRGFLLNNIFVGNTAAPLIYIGSSAATQEITIEGNEFSGLGSNSGSHIWVTGGKGHRIENNRSFGTTESFLRIYPGGAVTGARKFVKNVTVRNNYIRLDGNGSAGVFYIACSDDVTANNEYAQNILFDGNYAQVTTNVQTPLVRVQDTDTGNCRVLENLGSISITNNTMDQRAGFGCLFADRNTCNGGTGNVWSSKNTDNKTAIVASSNLPYMVGNTVDNQQVPDFPFHATSAAQALTAAQVGPGGIAVIYDDITARGTCSDAAVPGTLTGGGTFLSVCKVNASSRWVPF